MHYHSTPFLLCTCRARYGALSYFHISPTFHNKTVFQGVYGFFSMCIISITATIWILETRERERENKKRTHTKIEGIDINNIYVVHLLH